MLALRLHAFGARSRLLLEEAPTPDPAAGEFVIRTIAAGLNPVDAKIRTGTFKRFKPRLPAVLGRDLAGTVVAAGPRARGFKIGDQVFGLLDYERGAYAEYAVASARELARRPPALDPIVAAALPVAALTAWQSLFKHGRLRAGQRLLIHGAAGGVGHLAVQFARGRGAQVWATARAEDFAFVRQCGAGHVVDFARGRFEDEIEAMDVVLDLVGGETTARSWSVLRPGGVLVSTLGPPRPPRGAPARVRGREVVVQMSAAELGAIGRQVAAGRVRVAVARVFRLREGAAAHAALRRGGFRGKLVFDTR